MESTVSLIESLLKTAEHYGTTSLKLTKLRILDLFTNVLTKVIGSLVVLIVLLLFFLILNLGLALWLGDLLGKTFYGFFILAAFYLVLGIVLHFFLHNWIKKPIGNSIISQSNK